MYEKFYILLFISYKKSLYHNSLLKFWKAPFAILMDLRNSVSNFPSSFIILPKELQLLWFSYSFAMGWKKPLYCNSSRYADVVMQIKFRCTQFGAVGHWKSLAVSRC